MKRSKRIGRFKVGADGKGLVSHAGTALLRELAIETGLVRGWTAALIDTYSLPPTHVPGQVLVDLAVTIADGGDALRHLRALRDQAKLFGPVASDPTAWRVVDKVDAARLDLLRTARAEARARAWVAGAGPDLTDPSKVLRLHFDASLLTAFSEKQDAAPTWKKGFGFHPLLCYLDRPDVSGGEALAGLLRPGNAGSNTAAGAPRGATSYSQPSWEELGRRFLGLVAHLDPKGEGDNSMPVKRRPCQASGTARCGTRAIWLKLNCLNPNLQLMQGVIRRKDARNRCHVLRRHIGGVDATSRA